MNRRPLFWAFVAGAGLIVCIRLASPDLGGAIAAAVVALVVVVWLGLYYRNSEVIRRDRAGDDLYYLGLLLTLVSLIYALVWLFIVNDTGDVQPRVHEMIGNFGIALVSTVAGILGRILLQDTSGEPFGAAAPRTERQAPGQPGQERGDGEQQALLTQATREATATMLELRRQLREATDAFAHFTRVTLSHADHTKSHTQELLEDFNQRMASTAEGQLDATAAAWQHVAEALGTEGERLLSHIDEAVSGATKRTDEAWRDLAGGLDSASAAARQRLEADVEEMGRMLHQLATANGSLEALASSLDGAQSHVSALAETAASAAAALKANTDEMLAGQRQAMATTQRSVDALVGSLEAAKTDIAALGSAAASAATGAEPRIADILDTLNGMAESVRQQQEASLREWRDAASRFSADTREHLDQEARAWHALIDGFKTADSAQALSAETSRLAGLVKRLDGLLNSARSRP